MELYEHQKDAIERMHSGCILWAGVGTGKSITALGYYVAVEAPRDVYVITTAKKRDSLDWEREGAMFGLGRRYSVAGLLTVDSWNNIEKYRKVKNAFFIFDEQRLVGTGAWVKAFLEIAHANRWILLTATPGDTWLDYIPVFLANDFYSTRSQFIREHVVYNTYTKFPKVSRYLATGRLIRQRNQILVEMPYKYNTISSTTELLVDYDRDLYNRAEVERWHVFENRPLRDKAELCIVTRKIVNLDPSRLRAIETLMESHPKIIVFYNFDYELEKLRTLGSKTVLAEWNGHKHEPIPDSPVFVYLVQYVAGAEGWNCIDTNIVVFYSMTYSYKLYHQAKGRINRLNTDFKDLRYYVLKSNSPIDNRVWNALKSKRNFQPPKTGAPFSPQKGQKSTQTRTY